MKDQDWGFYGRGIDGYVHYKQDFDRIQGGGGAGGGSGAPAAWAAWCWRWASRPCWRCWRASPGC